MVNSTSCTSPKCVRARQHVATRPRSPGMACASSFSVCGVRRPETTSSPCASNRTSITGSAAPVEGSRENATPEPDVSPRLPNTMACTVTAVPCRCRASAACDKYRPARSSRIDRRRATPPTSAAWRRRGLSDEPAIALRGRAASRSDRSLSRSRSSRRPSSDDRGHAWRRTALDRDRGRSRPSLRESAAGNPRQIPDFPSS